MIIYIRTLIVAQFELDVEPADTIEYVKELIQNRTLIPPPMQRLVFAGKILEDGRTLTEYNIHLGSTINLVLVL
ncbi:Ubiquitin family protein [Pseudomonas syringae]|uniref:ubiquitin-like protein n=1 Tax=Pseudomonas syringae TaxID=317 RepID=UPI00089A3B5A|nr:Ubiquitin family protein [Pseudomonas syringae]SFL92563.1 Ubiquitin family protein [Pseudomonas syringae]